MKNSIPFAIVNNIKAKTTTICYKRMTAKKRNNTQQE